MEHEFPVPQNRYNWDLLLDGNPHALRRGTLHQVITGTREFHTVEAVSVRQAAYLAARRRWLHVMVDFEKDTVWIQAYGGTLETPRPERPVRKGYAEHPEIPRFGGEDY